MSMSGQARQYGGHSGMPDMGCAASEPSAQRSSTRRQGGRSRSPTADRPTETVQLDGVEEEPPADVCIIGDSLIHHLYDREVFLQTVNLELGESAVFWNVISSMRWEQLRPTIHLNSL